MRQSSGRAAGKSYRALQEVATVYSCEILCFIFHHYRIHSFISTPKKLYDTTRTIDRAILNSSTALPFRLTPRTQLPTMFAPRVFTSSSRQCLRKACQQPKWTPAVYQVSSCEASGALEYEANSTSRLDPTPRLRKKIRSPSSREREDQTENTLSL